MLAAETLNKYEKNRPSLFAHSHLPSMPGQMTPPLRTFLPRRQRTRFCPDRSIFPLRTRPCTHRFRSCPNCPQTFLRCNHPCILHWWLRGNQIARLDTLCTP